MLKRIAVFLCLLTAAYAKEPRLLADVPIRTPDLKKINLKQYRGKSLILIMISTTCKDCIATVGIMSKIQKDLGPRGLQVVGAAFDPNAAYTIEPFTQRYKPGFPMGYLDKEAAIKIADMPPGKRPFVPIVLFIDPTGVVRQQYYGDDQVLKQAEKTLPAIAGSFVNFNAQQAAPKKAAAPAAKQ